MSDGWTAPDFDDDFVRPTTRVVRCEADASPVDVRTNIQAVLAEMEDDYELQGTEVGPRNTDGAYDLIMFFE